MAEIKFKIAVRPSDPSRGVLMIECERHHTGYCERSIWTGPEGAAMWHWNGDVERPTLRPSIDCKGGCGRHFTLIKGQPT